MKYILSLMLVLQNFCGIAQKARDTIFLNNGSRFIGEIKKIKLGVITFDPDDANDITVQLKKVRTMAAQSKVFRIESIQHKVYFGKISPADSVGHALILTDTSAVIHPIEQISVLYPILNQLKQRFTGMAKAGFDFTRSSGLGRLNYEGRVTYTAKNLELNFSTAGIYTISDTSFSRDREDISIKNNYYFNTTWFATVLLKYQRNLELGLIRRFQQGLGGGNKFITSKHIYAWSRGGMVLNQEKNTENTTSGTLTELFGQLEFNFFRFTKPELSFSIGETFYYSLTQQGRVRNDAQLTLSWEIIKDIDLTISTYTNFDNQPPLAESSTFDMGVVFGIAFTFN
jgi:hypothetical protein